MPPKTRRLPRRDPITLVLYGPPGNGKTSFAAHFPRCGFIIDNSEKGIQFLQRRGLVPQPVWVDDNYSPVIGRGTIKKTDVWPRLVQRVWKAARDDSVDTVVLEAITGIEKILYAYHCMNEYAGDYSKEGFFAYQGGPKAAATFDLPELLEAMTAANENGKNVIITGHSQTKEEDHPEGQSLLKYLPYCNPHTWAALAGWASGVFFLGRKLERNVRAPGLKSKARADIFDRLLYVEGTPYCDAKNWLGLEGIINLGETPKEGYDNFISKLGA